MGWREIFEEKERVMPPEEKVIRRMMSDEECWNVNEYERRIREREREREIGIKVVFFPPSRNEIFLTFLLALSLR